MNFRSTIILFLTAIAGVAAMIVVIRRDAGPARTTALGGRLFSRGGVQIPVDSVMKITLKRHGEAPLVFVREAGGAQWRQVEPFVCPMDSYSMRQLIVSASELQLLDSFDSQRLPKGQSLAGLQLDLPAAELTLQWGGGGGGDGRGDGGAEGSVTLRLGRRSMAGRAYLQIAGVNRICVVDQKLHERALDMEPQEWRDRLIFHNVGLDSSRIEIKPAGAAPVVLVRERKQWKMIEPVQTRIDPVSRDAFMQDVSRALVSGFVLDQPTATDLARLGLAEPAAVLSITTPRAGAGAQSADTQTLLIGSRVGAKTEDRFGMIQGRPVVMRISAAVITALFRQPKDLADPVASGVNAADVKSIVIRVGKDELKLQRNLDQWQVPEHGNAIANAPFVQELLNQLTRLRAQNVDIKPYPTDLEVATVTLYGFDAKAIDTVRIAQEKDTGRWALENGDNVLRVFPAGMKLRLTAEEFGLK